MLSTLIFFLNIVCYGIITGLCIRLNFINNVIILCRLHSGSSSLGCIDKVIKTALILLLKLKTLYINRAGDYNKSGGLIP